MSKARANPDVYWWTSINSPVGELELIATRRGLRAVVCPGTVSHGKLSSKLVKTSKQATLELASKQFN